MNEFFGLIFCAQLNGILATFAWSSLSLTLIYISVPIEANEVRTYPIPIALPRLGDCVPEVTLPITVPGKSGQDPV